MLLPHVSLLEVVAPYTVPLLGTAGVQTSVGQPAYAQFVAYQKAETWESLIQLHILLTQPLRRQPRTRTREAAQQNGRWRWNIKSYDRIFEEYALLAIPPSPLAETWKVTTSCSSSVAVKSLRKESL